jgi:cell division septation protein DedD
VDALLAGRPAPASVAPAAAALPGVAKGGYAVQLAAAGSDTEARDKVGKLQRQFASALDGKSAGVVKGEANGKQVWRIRVGGLSREEANTMCGSIKESGGACFVAAN